MLFSVIRCSTPIINLDDDVRETQQNTPNEQTCGQYPNRTQPKPIGYERKQRIPIDTLATDFTQCLTINATVNRMKAEMYRQRVYGSIFVGPISNIGKTRQ